jgi:hypothetical protein
MTLNASSSSASPGAGASSITLRPGHEPGVETQRMHGMCSPHAPVGHTPVIQHPQLHAAHQHVKRRK